MAVSIPSDTVEKVATFLGQSTSNSRFMTQAAEHVEVIAEMAHEYTRGRGFTAGVPSDAMKRVIISASARLLANPEQLQFQTGIVTIRGAFDGWTPLEKVLLDTYRRRSA